MCKRLREEQPCYIRKEQGTYFKRKGKLYMITVAKDGTGDFTMIQEAVNALSNDDSAKTIFIKNGVYEEQVEIKVPYLTLKGESTEETVITYGLYANERMPDGYKRGTFRTYSVFIDTHDFKAENITFVNSAGLGKDVGQALALYVEGDHITFRNCNMLASQDTVFTGPLPPSVIKARGFVGPKENAPRINGRQYYEKCLIRGDVDFIFGSATVYFEECEIFSQNINKEVNGYVTAPSTPEGQEYGYVFHRCKFTSDCPPKTVYLGRPWRNFAQAVFLECELGAHIRDEGVHDWNKKDAHETMFFAEYKNYGPGANIEKREAFVKQLSDEEAKAYTLENVFAKC